VIEGRWWSIFIAINVDRAGADAIKIPTLLNSRLLMAIIKNIFAITSQVPERSAYFLYSPPFGITKPFLGGKTKVRAKTPNLAPTKPPRICELSISVAINEKPEKKTAAVAASKKIENVTG
jgi:hypothetical protein